MEHRVWSKSRAAAVLVLAIVIAVTVAIVDDRDEAQAAVNDQHTQGDFVYAELKAGSGVTLVKYKNTTAASVSIPSTTTWGDVTKIEYSAFTGCVGLKNVTLPATVSNISNLAFLGSSVSKQPEHMDGPVAAIIFSGDEPKASAIFAIVFGSIFFTTPRQPA